MATPTPVVTGQEWNGVREALLVKEKELMRARDALAAERRRLPMVHVDKEYRFEGPSGAASLLDLFDVRVGRLARGDCQLQDPHGLGRLALVHDARRLLGRLRRRATVEIKGSRRRVTGRSATADEKASYWPRLTAGYPFYDDYQARTTRDIPVIVLTPVGPRAYGPAT